MSLISLTIAGIELELRRHRFTVCCRPGTSRDETVVSRAVMIHDVSEQGTYSDKTSIGYQNRRPRTSRCNAFLFVCTRVHLISNCKTSNVFLLYAQLQHMYISCLHCINKVARQKDCCNDQDQTITSGHDPCSSSLSHSQDQYECKTGFGPKLKMSQLQYLSIPPSFKF